MVEITRDTYDKAASTMEQALEQNPEGLRIGELYSHLLKDGYDEAFCRSVFLSRLAHKVDVTRERKIKLLPQTK